MSKIWGGGVSVGSDMSAQGDQSEEKDEGEAGKRSNLNEGCRSSETICNYNA